MKIGFYVLVACLTLTACSSAPTHYYTLMPATDSLITPTVVPFQYELTTVNVPAQVDQPQIVVRQGESGVQILETERWASPLSDEVRSALRHHLRLQMGRADSAGVARDSGLQNASIQVDIRRLEMVPGHYALIEAIWSLRNTGGAGPRRSLSCTSVIRQEATAEMSALVLAHQQLIRELSVRIVQTVIPWMASSDYACPN